MWIRKNAQTTFSGFHRSAIIIEDKSIFITSEIQIILFLI